MSSSIQRPRVPNPLGGFSRTAAVAYGVLRVLAVVDAIALPALLIAWAWSWPKHGSLFGAVVSGLCAWWALKRAYRAVFGFDTYRWFAMWLLKLFVVAMLIKAAVFLAS